MSGLRRDRPILFSAPMVRAILEGRKSQTRRTLKRLRGFGPVTDFDRSDTPGYDWHFRDRDGRFHDLRDARLRDFLPYEPGMLLWVRENFHLNEGGAIRDGSGAQMDYIEPSVSYAADHRGDPRGLGWRPSIHMPRWASRLTLEVTAVKVERLRDISEEDAKAEGLQVIMMSSGDARMGTHRWFYYDCDIHGNYVGGGMSPRAAFEMLWTSINGPGSWEANPWVTAVSFKTHRMNIDQLIAQRSAA